MSRGLARRLEELEEKLEREVASKRVYRLIWYDVEDPSNWEVVAGPEVS